MGFPTWYFGGTPIFGNTHLPQWTTTKWWWNTTHPLEHSRSKAKTEPMSSLLRRSMLAVTWRQQMMRAELHPLKFNKTTLSWELTYPPKMAFWRWFSLFPRWDMLVPWSLPSLKLTVRLWKMDAWNTILSYWVSAYFQGRTVSFREGNKTAFFGELT